MFSAYSGVLDKTLTGGGETNTVAAALEKWISDPTLQMLDATADSRLRKIENF